MNVLKQILLFSLFTGCFVGCQTADSVKPKQLTMAADQNELREVSREWDRLFNAADAKNLALLYAENAVSMPPNLPTIRGRRAIQTDFESFFAAHTARHDTMVENHVNQADISVESARYRMAFKPKTGGTEIVETGRHMQCRRKIDGKWLIVMEIWNSDAPAK